MKKKNKVTLRDLKTKYLDKRYLSVIKDNYGQNIRDTYVSNIESVEKKDYNIFGYGSLMNYGDAQRSFKSIKNFEKYKITGWRRVFNLGTKGSYLNVVKTDNNRSLVGVKITIDYEDMLAFIEREILYNLIKLEEDDMFMVVANQNMTSYKEPVLSYVSLCIQGMKEIGTNNDVLNFLNTTIVYNGQALGQWLNNLDLVNYMLRNDHVSR